MSHESQLFRFGSPKSVSTGIANPDLKVAAKRAARGHAMSKDHVLSCKQCPQCKQPSSTQEPTWKLLHRPWLFKPAIKSFWYMLENHNSNKSPAATWPRSIAPATWITHWEGVSSQLLQRLSPMAALGSLRSIKTSPCLAIINRDRPRTDSCCKGVT